MKYAEEISAFMQNINALDTGDRTALRRSAGSRLEDSYRAWPAFYSAVPYSVPDAQLGRWFAAACLRTLWNEEDEPAVPLPEILHSMMKQDEWSNYLRARTIRLLESTWSDRDGYLLTKLTRLVKMLRQKGYRVDCDALLQDLIDWNSSSQIVQRRWASTIYRDKKREK